MVNGKVKEMDRILQKVAKWNKLDYRELRKNITQNIDFFNVEKNGRKGITIRGGGCGE